jgi:hypothetical protein
MKGPQGPRSSAEGSHVDQFVESRSSRPDPKRRWYKVARSGIRWGTPNPCNSYNTPVPFTGLVHGSLSDRLAFDVKTMCYKAAYAMPAYAAKITPIMILTAHNELGTTTDAPYASPASLSGKLSAGILQGQRQRACGRGRLKRGAASAWTDRVKWLQPAPSNIL